MEDEKPRHGLVGYWIYVWTWAGLLILTAATIHVAGLKLGKFSVLTAILIASVKAGLVLYIFMHLRYEERIFRIILFVVIATLTVIIGLTFLDVGFR